MYIQIEHKTKQRKVTVPENCRKVMWSLLTASQNCFFLSLKELQRSLSIVLKVEETVASSLFACVYTGYDCCDYGCAQLMILLNVKKGSSG
jgi:hypothetical protein